MAGFVRVSGYSKKDLDDAREEGYEEAVSDLVVTGTSCYGPPSDVGGSGSSTYTVPDGYVGVAIGASCATNDDVDSGYIDKNGSRFVGTYGFGQTDTVAGDTYYLYAKGGPRASISVYLKVFLHKVNS